MGERREDLDLYRGGQNVDGRIVARGVARTIGVLLGLAITFYGVVIYALRCFDTCPSDPAQDRVLQVTSGAVVLFGLVVVAAAGVVGTHKSEVGLWIVSALGAAIVVCGIVVVGLVPSIEAPGDHSGSTRNGVIAIVAGAVAAGVAQLALRGRPDPRNDVDT